MTSTSSPWRKKLRSLKFPMFMLLMSTVVGGVQVALLEPAPGNPTLNWPWVTRGTPEQGIRRVEAVSVPVGGASSSSKEGSGLLERAISSVLAGYGGAASSILQSAGMDAFILPAHLCS